MTAICTICTQPLGEAAYVCAPCAGTLSAVLRAIHGDAHLHGLDVDLDIALAKQAVFAPSSGGRVKPSEAPMPIDPGASEAAAVLRSTLTTWCRVAIDEGDTPPATDTLAAMAYWLDARVETIRHRPWAQECVDEVHAAVTEVRRRIERPAERVFVGECPSCGAALYGLADRDVVRCRAEDCDGVIEDAPRHREARFRQAAAEAPERLVTAAEGAMASRALGRPVSEQWIRRLAAQGRLESASAKRPARYRLGDIMDIGAGTHRKTA